MKHAIFPGSTIGVLGSGQLGRMLALAARPFSYHIHVFSPEANSPAGQVADREFVAAYDDLDAVREFAQSVNVVTYEFENVPLATAEACAAIVPLRPGTQVLRVAQNRLCEKNFFADNRLPTVPFASVHSLAELQASLADIGCPAVLKTAVSGYDGKGQIKINHPDEAVAAWQAVGEVDCILEGWVTFEREVSMVAARDVNGRIAHYNLIENSHHNHILDVSVAPANVPPQVLRQAEAMVQTVLTALDVVGALCVEFFLCSDGRLLLNEIAPRPHNSGHLTIEACVTSQFEQQMRTVCGLPVGDTSYLRPAAMANLLGDLWDVQRRDAEAQRKKDERNLRQSAKSADNISPDWTAVLNNPQLKLHLYGKKSAHPGRKMGHLTALADSVGEAEKIVRKARRRLETGD
ncbi:5-(carboxyamino)imidazole ribonucleotide synthase [Candidatus Leptofilum sp.]|uniref:5-(carboxyamino)imidazole ribonucleotide synthase n=1 Tax=Candidatus Leptofilum sp. TaxID=3241576 RepID=UPI003B5A9F0E